MEALAAALESDDPRLMQGATTTPPLLFCVKDFPVEAACAFGLCGAESLGGFKWEAKDFPAAEESKAREGAATVAEVEEFFAQLCFEVDGRLGEPAACRWFLNWFDETPRDEMRLALLPEVRLSLAERKRDAEERLARITAPLNGRRMVEARDCPGESPELVEARAAYLKPQAGLPF